MRLLLVEDQPDEARLIAKGLREQSYAVDVAANGVVTAHHAVVDDYDATVRDVMLPGVMGSRLRLSSGLIRPRFCPLLVGSYAVWFSQSS